MTRQHAWKVALAIAAQTLRPAVVLWGYQYPWDDPDRGDKMTYFAASIMALYNYPNDTVIDTTEE